MNGITDVLRSENVALTGGHTAETAEFCLGLSVNGFSPVPPKTFTADEPHAIILTKRIGHGIIYAADNLGDCPGIAKEMLIKNVLQSNAAATSVIFSFDGTYATDVTGYGLIGCLQQFFSQNPQKITLNLNAVPTFDGIEDFLTAGYLSSIDVQNRHFSAAVKNEAQIKKTEFYAKKKLQPKPVILDIRDLDVSVIGTAEGAHCLPYESLEDRMIQLPPFGTIILFSDKADTNIHGAVKMLWENGFTDLFYVKGGYEAIVDELVQLGAEATEQFRKLLPSGATGYELIIKGFDYMLAAALDKKDPKEYLAVPKAGTVLYISRKSIRRAEGTVINMKDGKLIPDHPSLHRPRPEGNLKDRTQKVIDEMINPSIAMHGGFISLIDINDDTLYIEMGGGCQGCGMSKVTLKQGVETIIRDNIPEIEYIYDTTDHASGQNPYYRPE
ncbi:hypothetical protein CHS0354_035321 [Potamilus streckersoni]|uniref:Rhodanese domain-containing protein n=1 Tax=Potamilus streckersoni TaxID=2493646 RepID=A0AAE0S2W3_9BIVA|nr:hypothetical protein CHS0354_035321 [Potamilus streckersoni]